MSKCAPAVPRERLLVDGIEFVVCLFPPGRLFTDISRLKFSMLNANEANTGPLYGALGDIQGNSFNRFSDCSVRLHRSQRLVCSGALSSELYSKLEPILRDRKPEAFLIPEPGYAKEVIPLDRNTKEVFELISSGYPLHQAVDRLTSRVVRRLLIGGVLVLEFKGIGLTGPAAMLAINGVDVSTSVPPISTDQLSLDALLFAARLRLNDLTALAIRLYLYNQHPIFGSRELEGILSQVKEIVNSSEIRGFKEVPPPATNPGWHFFKSSRNQLGVDGDEIDYKVYVSPVVSDLPSCLAQLREILPATEAVSWKIGRDAFGISRSDKICIYFPSESDANAGGFFLAKTLQGLKPQGIPFTHRYDSRGLVSGGMDPPRPEYGIRATYGTSWRDWVTRRLAAALILAQVEDNGVLTPAETALWSMYYLGVDPSGWTVKDANFWSN